MPKARTYTDTGYIEVQWAKDGRLVCIVSAEVDKTSPSGRVERTAMHQFTQRGDVGLLLRDLRRARKQAFEPFGA